VLKRRVRRVHLIGIGGSGMCGIAEVLLTLGYEVSGSDIKKTEITEGLRKRGAIVKEGHSAANVAGAQVAVFSSAIDMDNSEIREARRLGIPLIRRAEMLAELMRLKLGIAVAGTHGKTTTTSMIGAVMTEAGLDPTVVIGGRLNNLQGHARLGKGEYIVVEADESDASFLCLNPILSVITNIDDDHLDHYRSRERLQAAFLEFSQKVPFYGAVVACLDDSGVRLALPEISRQVITYGFTPGAILRGERVTLTGSGSSCEVSSGGKHLGNLRLRAAGRHNLSNALAAVAVGLELEVPFEKCAAALADYAGVARRLQFKGESKGVRVCDDYGHHPTEIRATLEAARMMADESKGRLLVLFQPHRYSRTNLLRDEFSAAFDPADSVTLAEIYAAGEVPIPGVSARLIRDGIAAHGRPTG
jgi:UDP-N-acetylmuramate--alanine ligase